LTFPEQKWKVFQIGGAWESLLNLLAAGARYHIRFENMLTPPSFKKKSSKIQLPGNLPFPSATLPFPSVSFPGLSFFKISKYFI
jgi:hypothetical protein